MRGAFFLADPVVVHSPYVAHVPTSVRKEWADYRADAKPDELRAGMAVYTPLDALRTATTDAARYAGDDPGRIGFRIGSPADLVLLAADPRRDIRNTRSITWVIQRGIAYDRTTLDAKLAASGDTP